MIILNQTLNNYFLDKLSLLDSKRDPVFGPKINLYLSQVLSKQQEEFDLDLPEVLSNLQKTLTGLYFACRLEKKTSKKIQYLTVLGEKSLVEGGLTHYLLKEDSFCVNMITFAYRSLYEIRGFNTDFIISEYGNEIFKRFNLLADVIQLQKNELKLKNNIKDVIDLID